VIEELFGWTNWVLSPAPKLKVFQLMMARSVD